MKVNHLVTIFLLHCVCTTTFAREQIAKVEVMKRIARSSSAMFAGEDYDFDVGVSTGGTTHRLKLRSAGQILSPNFKYHEVDVHGDGGGQTIFRDLTPSTRRLREIQKHVYIDASKNTAVRLKRMMDRDGEFELEGLVNGFRIRRHAGGEHLLETEETIPIPAASGRPSRSGVNHSDYVIIDRPMVQGRGLLLNAIIHATPEIAVVFDYVNSKHFNFDRDAIIDYLVVLFNAVNNRYAFNVNPKITCQLVGVHVIKSLDAQPFINDAKSETVPGKYSLKTVASKFSEWAYQNAKLLPKHDIVPLISGVDFEDLAGRAVLSGACYFDMNQDMNAAALIAHDGEGHFEGVSTLAHEVAHNMGAPHDGELDSTACPQSDGYLMSYEGWGKDNKSKLSKCSQDAMRKFIASSGGACLLMKTQGLKVLKTSAKEVGDVMDVKKYCENIMDDKLATVYYNPWSDADDNEACRNIRCRSGDLKQGRVTGQPPGDNAPCGNGGRGKCQNGKCIKPEIQ